MSKVAIAIRSLRSTPILGVFGVGGGLVWAVNRQPILLSICGACAVSGKPEAGGERHVDVRAVGVVFLAWLWCPPDSGAGGGCY